jgi:hypothetical protein
VGRIVFGGFLQREEVLSFFHKLSISEVSSFPWRSIWKVKVPMHVSFFV